MTTLTGRCLYLRTVKAISTVTATTIASIFVVNICQQTLWPLIIYGVIMMTIMNKANVRVTANPDDIAHMSRWRAGESTHVRELV